MYTNCNIGIKTIDIKLKCYEYDLLFTAFFQLNIFCNSFMKIN